MHRHHCIFPYENENRETLMAMPFEPFHPKRITLCCSELNNGLEEQMLVSRGQCIGFMDEVPVYAGIDGRIERIIKKQLKHNQKGFEILISLERHRQCLWSEIPFYEGCSGVRFLRQLGISCDFAETKAQILWIDGVESEPVCLSGYRLLAEETVKVILGADILARCFKVEKVYFCIEQSWPEILYLLEKYLGKYKSLLDEHIEFRINQYERCYPMTYNLGSNLVFTPHTAVHVYNGYFEKTAASNAWVSVSGLLNREGNFVIPSGTHISDILRYCGCDSRKEIKVVANGLIKGRAMSPEYGTVTPDICSLYVMENIYNIEKDCKHCRVCASVCPIGLKPYIADKETVEKCIHCGNCSYVCPSNRRLSERLRRGVMVPERTKKSSGHRFIRTSGYRTVKMADYIEIAPEFADVISEIPQFSDAPPHIHQEKKQNVYFWKPVVLMLPMLCWACVQYGADFVSHLFFSLTFGLACAAIKLYFIKEKKVGIIYSFMVFSALLASLAVPVGDSPVFLLFANIMACILSPHNL